VGKDGAAGGIAGAMAGAGRAQAIFQPVKLRHLPSTIRR
jgi:hypothetical protein